MKKATAGMLWILLASTRAFTLDATNAGTVGLDLYTVAERHQADLVSALSQRAEAWLEFPQFRNAAILKSTDGVRVFAYSQWVPSFDHRDQLRPLDEFFAPESFSLEITASQSREESVTVEVGDRLTHLAEFRMPAVNQPKMIALTTDALDQAMDASPGLISATFHRSLDGTRMFNYGQWENEAAFANLEKQPGFSKAAPYWEGLARNEFHLYNVVHVTSA